MKMDKEKTLEYGADSTIWKEEHRRPGDNRYVIFPIQYPTIWKMFKKAQSSYWTKEEIDLSKDLKDWNAMNEKEQHFIEHVLAFFAASDGIVLENLAERFMQEIAIPEVRFFYGMQILMELIHSETYSALIETYVSDSKRRAQLLHGIEEVPTVKLKAKWALKWFNGDQSHSAFAERLIAFAVVEGIFFSSSFCAIFWIKKSGKMHGLTFSNELISRDEGMHVDFAVLLYSMLDVPLPEERVFEILEEAVEIEKQFISEALPNELLGMNASLMIQYILYVADKLLLSLGYNRRYNVVNPFDWMELISLEGKANIFERHNPNYAKFNITSDADENNNFRIDLDV